MTVAYFGPSGTFTESATREFISRGIVPQTELIPFGSPQEVIDAVRERTVTHGCVPLESSVEGSVAPTLDGLVAGTPVQILAETQLPIRFSVVLSPHATSENVSTVAAYPVAAAQVRTWLSTRWPQCVVVPASSNSAEALDAAEGRVDAAVTTPIMAQRVSLPLAAEGIIDHDGAKTRFALVSNPLPPLPRTGSDRTAVAIRLTHTPGSLAKAMNQIALRDLDLIRIESRPTRDQPEPYWFFLDFVGHLEDALVTETLKALRQHSQEVYYLGSWSCEAFGGSQGRSLGVAPASDAHARAWTESLGASRG